MKTAIASEGKEEISRVSEMGGKSPYYLIFEDEKMLEAVKNPFATGGGGSGFSVAYMLAEKGVEVIVAGKIGENMERALLEKGIRYVENIGEKSVKESVLKYLKQQKG